MATRDLTLEVITPERRVLSESTDSVVIPAHDGELGVLTDRAPLLCELGVGQLRYRSNGATRRVFVDGGFAQIVNNTITVLTNQALTAEQITPEVVEKAEQAARETGGRSLAAADQRRHAQRKLSTLRKLRGA